MNPISQERVKFIQARISILREMNLELMNKHTKWPEVSAAIKQKSLELIQAEKLVLEVEFEVLTNYLRKINGNTTT